MENVQTKTVNEAIEYFSKNAENYSGVLLMAIDKDGNPILNASGITNNETAYLKCFLDRVVSGMFTLNKKID